MENLNDRDHAEILMLYQITTEDIERTKQWGWTVAYTTIGAQAALLGLFSAYKSSGTIGLIKAIFIALIISLTVLGLHYIRHAQTSLSGFRERIQRALKLLGTPFNNALGDSTSKELWPLEYFCVGSCILVCSIIALSST